MSHESGLVKISKMTSSVYIPFAEEIRAISWPTEVERPDENDAEHSFSLALICAEIAPSLGLDPNIVAVKALVHDLVEVNSGDTSAWDVSGLKTKEEREHIALKEMTEEHGEDSWMIQQMKAYDQMLTEEDRFVYAMDKLMAVLMIVNGGGKFWKKNGISFEMYKKKYAEKRNQVALHPVVVGWYDQLHMHILFNHEVYFDK